LLQRELALHGDKFVGKFHQLHLDCMTVLAGWSANIDHDGHCGVVMKLHERRFGRIGLTIQQLRANAFNT